MSEAAVLPRGSAVAHSGEVQMVETGRSDGRNRRAAETRRKIIAAAKEMIAETSTAPTVVAVAKRADVSVRSVFQHFGDVESLFVTVVDSVRGDLVVPPPYISLQGLDEGGEAQSPRGSMSTSDALVWTNGGALGLTKKAWYQMIGRSDDGKLSDDSAAFYRELAKLGKIAIDVDDRASAAKAAVEAMDKLAAMDPPLKKRLLEQAASASKAKQSESSKEVKRSHTKKEKK